MNTLQHHGIKGQKWGVRRFQNKTGSLTSAGKKRYSNEQIDRQQDNQLRNPFAYHTTRHAKRAVKSGVAAVGTALVSSAAVKVLSDKGYNKAASTVYNYSKKTVNTLKFISATEMGATAVNAMMTSPDSLARYLKEERRIKNME